MSKSIDVLLPEQAQARLLALAEATGRSVSDLAGEAVALYLDDAEDAREAEQVLARVRSGRERVFELCEAERVFGLDG